MWFNFVSDDLDNITTDEFGCVSFLVFVHTTFQANADFRVKAGTLDAAIDGWHRANQTTTHCGAQFVMVSA